VELALDICPVVLGGRLRSFPLGTTPTRIRFRLLSVLGFAALNLGVGNGEDAVHKFGESSRFDTGF
jgi:hypothetical protein